MSPEPSTTRSILDFTYFSYPHGSLSAEADPGNAQRPGTRVSPFSNVRRAHRFCCARRTSVASIALSTTSPKLTLDGAIDAGGPHGRFGGLAWFGTPWRLHGIPRLVRAPRVGCVAGLGGAGRIETRATVEGAGRLKRPARPLGTP